MDRRIWLQCSLSGALVIVFIISVVIGVLAVGKDGNKKAGILTLQVSMLTTFSGKISLVLVQFDVDPEYTIQKELTGPEPDQVNRL